MPSIFFAARPDIYWRAMAGILFRLIVLAFAAQAGTTLPPRTGYVARSLTDADIAAIEASVGANPWLVDGISFADRMPDQSQTITVYFAPTTATPTLRRGGYLRFSRQLTPNVEPWTGVGSAKPYARVAISGRLFKSASPSICSEAIYCRGDF
jgi:hypothetical protein